MKRKFWSLNNLSYDDSSLRIKMTELISYENELAPPVDICGVVITGHPLLPREESEAIELNFPTPTEFRVVPEIQSWPVYEDGEEIIPCLLYKKPGLFFYGKDCSQVETYDQELGWVKAEHLQCFIVHSESVDIYVLSGKSPIIKGAQREG